MKKVGFISILILLFTSSFSQEKPPEIADDNANIIAGDTITINVLQNDWGMEGHSLQVFFVGNPEGGEVSFTDSTITYSSYYYFEGHDQVRYNIKDMDNGLVSENGYLYLEVSNEGKSNIDVNNIDAKLNSYGYQFTDYPDFEKGFEVPKGSGRITIFAFTLWMGGLNENEQLHIAGERYRQGGADYFVGPVGNDYENQQIIDWNKVWKLSNDELEYHRNNWWKPGYQPIESILSWPAHGDIQQGQSPKLAPFFDNDEDGIYDPYSGDVPVVRGDQSALMIYNDDIYPHEETKGNKIGAEIHATAFAYECPQDSIFNNSIFFHYDIINKSDTFYHDFYLSSYIDFDLGGPWDDFVGCDTMLNSFFAYNGDDFDDDSFLYGEIYGYYDHPPAQGVTFLNQELSSFIGFINPGGALSDPYYTDEYYNILRGRWKDSTTLTYGGNGYGGLIPTKYLYPGNPTNELEWSEISSGNSPADRRGLGTIGPYNFSPGDTIHVDMAFVFARDYEGDHLSSVSLLKERIAQLQWYYDNDSTPCGTTWSGNEGYNAQNQHIKIYPNPVSDHLIVHIPELDFVSSFKIYNLVGSVVQNGVIDKQEVRINVKHLRRGYYIIKIDNPNFVLAEKFMKY